MNEKFLFQIKEDLNMDVNILLLETAEYCNVLGFAIPKWNNNLVEALDIKMDYLRIKRFQIFSILDKEISYNAHSIVICEQPFHELRETLIHEWIHTVDMDVHGADKWIANCDTYADKDYTHTTPTWRKMSKQFGINK